METSEIKNVYKWAGWAFLVLAVFLGVKTLDALKDMRNADPAYSAITVSGEGEVLAIPDVASFSFSISADNDVVSSGQEEVGKKVDEVLAALEKLGVEEKDIKTTDYSVYPKYVYTTIYCITAPCPGRQEQKGFTVSQTISVKVRETAKAGEALSAVGAVGVNNLSGLNFTIDDEEALVAEAREMAIQDAKEKARRLTKDLGVRLVRVVGYSDSSDQGLPYYRETMSAGMGGDGMMISKAPSLPEGENRVQVRVSVTYEIR